jgi:hypothetical protein
VPLPFWKSSRPKSVRQDWHAELPPEKSQVYAYALEQAQPAHHSFSVALDQALMFRRSGKHEMARGLADVSAELCVRFAAALECLLNVVERHADNFGLLPSVAPLNPTLFEGETAKRAANMNSLLSDVLFGERKRFLHKVRTLGEMACNIAEEYRVMTSEVCVGSTSPSASSTKQNWDHLSLLQYDLTTSLSEASVMLKSFIISLPPGEVIGFRDRLAKALLAMQAAPQHISPKKSPGTPAVPDRRASAFRGE